MRKKIIVFSMSLLLAFQGTVANNYSNLYAYTVQDTSIQDEQEAKAVESDYVYVAHGEGDEDSGNGTIKTPYQNLRTALQRIQDGQTLVLVGDVKYTKYEQYADGSAKPLFINKNITITGDTPKSGLEARTTIQLGADVTFKDVRLSLVPETDLSGGGKILGTDIERSNTIFVAGHTLVMDNVRTRVGTSPDQYYVRPFISGGAHKYESDKVGNHAVIKIINSNSETRLAAIYAGDYWTDRVMPVDIFFDGKLEDTVIHVGGASGYILNGEVNVTLYKTTCVTEFDRVDHLGTLNVTMAPGAFSSDLNVTGVSNLVLEENSRITLPKEGEFQVENVSLKSRATIDFRGMTKNPQIKNNFISTVNDASPSLCGAVLIGNERTLEIGGEVQGLTRLNTNGAEYIEPFIEGHVYVSSNGKSSGNFTISGTQYSGFSLVQENSNGSMQWVVKRKAPAQGEEFNHFAWGGGEDSIVNPEVDSEYLYPVEFYNNNGELYKPDMFELLRDFEYSLVSLDGEEVDIDWDIFTDWDDNAFGDDNTELHRVKLIFYNIDKIYGDLILTVSNIETGAFVERTIHVVQGEEEVEDPIPTPIPTVKPTQTVTPVPTVKPTQTATPVPTVKPTQTATPVPTVKPTQTAMPVPTVKPIQTATPVPTLKPDLSINKTTATLYTTGVTSVQLTVNGTNGYSVTFSSSDEKVAKVSQTGKVTALSPGTAQITAECGGEEISCKVIVRKSSIKLDKTSVTLYTTKSTTVKIMPTVVGSSKLVTYTSNNVRAAKVDKTGKITAVGAGTAIITAKANGVSATCKVTVKKPTLTVAQTKLSVKVGKRQAISVKVTPTNTISYTTSNKRIATVDSKGVVKGVRPGTAKITVKCNGLKKEVNVTVKK